MTSVLRYGWIKCEAGHKFHLPETRFGSTENKLKTGQKTKRTGPETRADALGGSYFLVIGCRSFQNAGLAELERSKSLRADTGSGRSRTARADAATCSGSRTRRWRCRRPAPRS